jgi:ferredoxin-NADP reductase
MLEAAPDGNWCDIAVLREDEGRGGSRSLHDEVEVGSALEIEVPENEFPLAPATRQAILIAGGIGVTRIEEALACVCVCWAEGETLAVDL